MAPDYDKYANMWLVDAHFHLAWEDNPCVFAEQAYRSHLGIFGVTVSPEEYRGLCTQLSSCSAPTCIGLGLHPWYWGRGDPQDRWDKALANQQLQEFKAAALTTSYIGEIGLDFFKTSQDAQEAATDAFYEMCEAIQPLSVISIHSVCSVTAVLKVLEQTGRLHDSACIFHWFSGTSEELVAAQKAGVYFSVGPLMLKSKKGREYARQIPPRQLLFETDYPAHPNSVDDVQAHRQLLLETLLWLKAEKRNSRMLERELAATQKRLWHGLATRGVSKK